MIELSFEVETDRGNVSRRLLSEVVHRHSRTLEVLQLTSCWGCHWAVGRLPEYAVGVSQCSKLRVLGIVVEGNKIFTAPVLSLLRVLPNLQTLRLVAHTNDFTLVVKRIECIRDDESLLKRLQVIVSVSCLGRIKFAAGRSGWDFDNEEPDVLRDDPRYLGDAVRPYNSLSRRRVGPTSYKLQIPALFHAALLFIHLNQIHPHVTASVNV